jgi:transcriptional regulator with XRE-family HTH domain
MRKPEPLPAFPEYLREAISRMRYQTPTEFARAAGISSSVVSRWLNGQVRPDVPLLERVAPHLGTKLSTLVRIAYPEIDEGLPIEDVAPLHPLAAELQRRLGPQSTLAADEQDVLTRIIDSVLAPYRSRSTPRGAT